MPGRDNGFVARHYVPLADLDPRLADAMLDVLRAEGIAAYVEPSAGRVGGYLEIYPHEIPRDRLWVDREWHDRAAALLSAHGDATDPTETDDVWAQLVASFDLPASDPAPRWPAAEDLPASEGRTASPIDADTDAGQLPLLFEEPPDSGEHPGAPVPRRIIRPAEPEADRAATVTGRGGGMPTADDAMPPYYSGYDPLSVLDEHFVPPPPPPVPALRPATRWAIASIVVGVAVLASQAFTDVVPDAVVIGTLGIVGGFVTLVAGMRTERPSDSDPDDGAVV